MQSIAYMREREEGSLVLRYIAIERLANMRGLAVRRGETVGPDNTHTGL